MKRFVLPFLAALVMHIVFLRSCILPVQKPDFSIVNQEISIRLDHFELANDAEPKQPIQKIREPEPQKVEKIKEVKAEQDRKPSPLAEKSDFAELTEIKDINTPVQVGLDEGQVEENRQEKVRQVISEPAKILEEEAVEQKQIVEMQESFVEDREDSSSLSSVVIEAVPLYRLNPPPMYPRRARKRGYEGVVVLDVLVNKQGRPVEIKVGRSSGYGQLDRAAERAVRQWIFEPATRGQEKISMNVLVPIRFQLTEINR